MCTAIQGLIEDGRVEGENKAGFSVPYTLLSIVKETSVLLQKMLTSTSRTLSF